MSDRPGLFDRILASLHEVALVPGPARLPGTEAKWARTTGRLVSNKGRTTGGDRQKTGERR